MRPFEDMRAALLAAATPLSTVEQVPTAEALGRVLAVDQISSLDVPPLDNSSMDGYALRCADVPAAGARLVVAQRIPAGSVGHTLAPGTAARIFTGAPIPHGADAVVMQELCSLDGDGVLIDHLPRPGEWIRRAGEDIARGAVVLTAGQRLGPQMLGLAASVGCATLPVFRRLRVALFSTGDELVMPGEPLPPGAIYNSNRYVLRGLLEALGCQVCDLGIVPDSLEATRAALRAAAGSNDLIITSGGVSVGEEDHVKPAVQAEGQLDLWLVAMKPGKPVAFGRVNDPAGGNGADFIGLPGNPVSSFVTFLMLVRPFILRRMGVEDCLPHSIRLPAGFDWPRPDRRREFLRARVGEAGQVELFPNQGPGVLSSTVWAAGLVDNPAGHAIAQGEPVSFIPYSELLS
ncbi:molybdopterin molybdenumtransferase MoeA [Zoogloea ramigera]|uniref:Molybdopterin molybdenumtransferase n=1 Tax=Zoogloea ramigera TaxID=350 RepID=A0A4Y4CQ25_ZOORA|nr:gephyrin-like molybdotransferase Glp [Zoogloea ramigera]MBP6800550.1 molybdopterin molybdotransferase MoeA [Zoogloea sp.]GEC95008.1 molybdopterin molybdenumtransferase MoeA [Zoogloea ramigera]